MMSNFFVFLSFFAPPFVFDFRFAAFFSFPSAMGIAEKLGRSLLRSSSFLFVRCLKRDDDGDDDEGGLATMTTAVVGDYWPLTTVFGRQEKRGKLISVECLLPTTGTHSFAGQNTLRQPK